MKGEPMAREPFTDENGNLLPGYRAYNGYVFTAADCAVYNDANALMQRARSRGADVYERARDARHMAFCTLSGCNA